MDIMARDDVLSRNLRHKIRHMVPMTCSHGKLVQQTVVVTTRKWFKSSFVFVFGEPEAESSPASGSASLSTSERLVSKSHRWPFVEAREGRKSEKGRILGS